MFGPLSSPANNGVLNKHNLHIFKAKLVFTALRGSFIYFMYHTLKDRMPVSCTSEIFLGMTVADKVYHIIKASLSLELIIPSYVSSCLKITKIKPWEHTGMARVHSFYTAFF